jgi:hypothetical protein
MKNQALIKLLVAHLFVNVLNHIFYRMWALFFLTKDTYQEVVVYVKWQCKEGHSIYYKVIRSTAYSRFDECIGSCVLVILVAITTLKKDSMFIWYSSRQHFVNLKNVGHDEVHGFQPYFQL